MTMIGELFILNVRPSKSVQIAVYVMILGSVVSALDDLGFNLQGYIYVLLNDAFTAGNGVLIKKKLESKDLGKYGLMYYNSLFMIAPALIFYFVTEDFGEILGYEGWYQNLFVFQFFLSCVFGFILTFSNVMCTAYNSALTTTMVGTLKNM